MANRAKPQKAASAVTAAAVAAPGEAPAAEPQAEHEEGVEAAEAKGGKRATDRILQKRGEPSKKRKANARDIR